MTAPPNDHLGHALDVSASSRRGRIGAAIATGTTTYHLARQAWNQWEEWQRRRSYTITVTESDDVYGPLQAEILAGMPEVDQRALTAHTHHQRAEGLIADGDRVVVRKVQLHYDGSRDQKLMVEGHPVQVRVERPEQTGANSNYRKPHQVVFTMQDVAARAAVVRMLQAIAEDLGGDRRTPRLYVATTWGEWRHARDLAPRTLDSVFLPAGHLDAVMDDLRTFLGAEARYATLGVPWHRGYLFHGEPGTGKSTTAAAMGTTLGLDVFVMSISDVQSNARLGELFSNVPARSMLLLEDIDVVRAARDRTGTEAKDPDAPGVTLDGLLNQLDGVTTPHGLITVMTTNNRSALDDALIRPGRVDHELEMGPLGRDVFPDVVAYFTGADRNVVARRIVPLLTWPRVTPAQVVGACVDHMHDPKAATAAAMALLTPTLPAV